MSTKPVLLFLLLAGVSIILVATAATFVFVPVSQSSETALLTIEPGTGVNAISQQLKDRGLILSTLAFESYVWLRNAEKGIQAGTYAIPRNLSVAGLTQLLTIGAASSNETVLTVIEGRRREQIAVDVASVLAPDDADKHERIREAFLELTSSPDAFSEDFPFLADLPREATLEGYLFPDTYRVFQDADIQGVVTKMLENFDRRVTGELREQLNAQGHTLHDAVTIASLLESEVRTLNDRRMVTDLIARRIDAGIALQLDATITFLTNKTSAEITQADLEIDSPYNTYAVRGLPPGPISNPGLVSFQAVADPLPNEFFYYLSTDEGETIFSTTFEEHVANKRLYL